VGYLNYGYRPQARGGDSERGITLVENRATVESMPVVFDLI
jgi:hypothetical protein